MDRQIEAQEFEKRAQLVLAEIARLREHEGLDEAIRQVMEDYVDGEPHTELQRLAKGLGFARRQALIQQRLDEDREALHHGHLSHEELVSVGHHYEMLRHQACEYNHLLRNMIEVSGQLF